ncbi:TonB-dependent receptor domain-containing protein [Paraglaciecola arctica]|uniref:TonB-dependent receptor domain-containing protein n=1 Tax=Paraglaciecola arctica TaxID=1128911 RepID=UPI001C072A09|nr:TonB-dependent receptor [Paraglaciecola arctica]MBU3001884.1 TonB-dependent receptor [Paraglaciecola arctica]
MKIKTKISTLAVAISAQLLAANSMAIAQEQEVKEDQAIELIMVTGSFVRRSENFESPSPLAVVDSVAIDAIGAKSIGDITQTLTINTGAENTPDAFTQNATAGTSNMNLRGLGVASTLILLNNKRQVVTAQPNNAGVNFVDTSSLIPMIALNRMEIVKDGASALYGSDAVAGVVNFITKRNYEGTQISLDYQDGAHGDNKEYTVQGLWGTVGDDSSIMAAISYTNRSPLFTGDRRLSRPQDDTSSLGSPGSYFLNGTPFIDPTGCTEFGGSEILLAPSGTVPGLEIGFCGFDFGRTYSFVPDESRLSTFVQAKKQLTDNIEWTTEFSTARNRAERGGSPTFPILTFPTVPADHPGNPFGADVSYFGREIGNAGDGTSFPGDPANTESDTFRFSTMLQGELDTGFWEISYTAARNNYLFTVNDTLAQEFQNALRGFGGQGCDPLTGTAGVGPCEYFNPFATSFTVLPNSQNVIDSFTGREEIDSKSNLEVVEAFVSTELFEMDGGSAGLAFGAQYRYQDLTQDYDSLANQDRFSFVIGNADIYGEQDVYALFGELALPVSDDMDIQIALRYEDYGGTTGDTVDPKFAVSWRATEDFSLRGSISTSFRAPSIFQRDGGGTSLNQMVDPLTGAAAFAADRTSGNDQLVPEESTAYNLGFSLEPVDSWSIEVDYWNFDFTDLIIKENFQAVLNAEPQNPERVIRAGDPLNGPLLQVLTTYVNASSLETSGLDLVSSYQLETEVGTFTPSISATYILAYDLVDPQSGPIDGVGLRNFSNIGVSTPEMRANLGLNWKHDSFSANIFARYIDSYSDDQNCADGTVFSAACTQGYKDVDSHLTWDAQVNIDLGGVFETEGAYVLSLGGVNLTDEEPPQLFTNAGFDSKVHDPRGRQIYARLAIEF